MIKQDISSTLCLNTSTARAPVCDACCSSPTTVFCQADLAYLCTTCDAAIHSANPLSRRHHRVPVVYGPRATEPWSGGGFLSQESEGTLENEDEDEAASWLVFDSPPKTCQSQNGESNRFLCNGDEYLDLLEYNSCQETMFSDESKFEDEYKHMNDGVNKNNSNQQQRYGGCDADSVVPVHCGEVKKYHQLHHHNFQNQKFQLGINYETSNGGYGYPASLGHSVSMSSLEAGTVPDSTITEADPSISNARNLNATIDLFSSPSSQMPTQLPSIDREARVLRYREKKKTRKFEKTIRYASRKAYAETRPRIKGRFAKRTTNVDIEVDQMLSPKLIIEAGYYILPSS